MRRIGVVLGLSFGLGLAVTVSADPAKEVSGTITANKDVEKKMAAGGVLYIFARTAAGGPPAAVLRIVKPKFPLQFTLSAANAMMPGAPFEGPFTITARYSPTGDAMDKSGPQGEASDKNIKPGAKNIKVELK